jgi:hypothetical protein
LEGLDKEKQVLGEELKTSNSKDRSRSLPGMTNKRTSNNSGNSKATTVGHTGIETHTCPIE